ncbi:hypothetical protein GJR88_00785 [Dietzia sp. DQ12-45-1b]|nr:hypothetical protein GJR88_00785 [Dietzia sp. DQ12-45-1b]
MTALTAERLPRTPWARRAGRVQKAGGVCGRPVRDSTQTGVHR